MNRNIIDSETIELPGGYAAVISIEPDDFDETPWEHCDGHGPVSDWTTRDKAPGEWILAQDRGSKRYYDAAEAQRMALRDGWDSPPYKTGTKRERAARAVKADFEYLRAWCNDEWCYVNLDVVVTRDGEEVASDSLCSVESCGDYWKEEGRRMAEYAAESDTKARKQAAVRKGKETRERNYWAARDCATV